METEACNIIQLYEALHRAFPETQFLWHPSTASIGYTSNFEWKGTRESGLIAQMKKHHTGAELIELTLKEGWIYYR